MICWFIRDHKTEGNIAHMWIGLQNETEDKGNRCDWLKIEGFMRCDGGSSDRGAEDNVLWGMTG